MVGVIILDDKPFDFHVMTGNSENQWVKGLFF
jgi:hypothetical protein